MKHITTDGGRSIWVFDNVFEYDYQLQAYTFMRNSLYRIGWEDTNTIETQHHKYLYSIYDQVDLNSLGFMPAIKSKELTELLSSYNVGKTVVNISRPMDSYHAHTHPEDIVVLYYANTDWRNEWAGETLFFNNDLTEIEFASIYKPGRVIVFDAKIPHTIRAPSILAPDYRFSLSIFMNKR